VSPRQWRASGQLEGVSPVGGDVVPVGVGVGVGTVPDGLDVVGVGVGVGTLPDGLGGLA
jgi:hypothetical protein